MTKEGIRFKLVPRRRQIDGLLTLLRVLVSDSRLSQQHCVYSASWRAQVLAGRNFLALLH